MREELGGRLQIIKKERWQPIYIYMLKKRRKKCQERRRRKRRT